MVIYAAAFMVVLMPIDYSRLLYGCQATQTRVYKDAGQCQLYKIDKSKWYEK